MTDYRDMDPGSPALHAARALVRATGARLAPGLPGNTDGAIVLVDEAPSEEALAQFAEALPSLTAIVLWAPGWDQAQAVGALERHGFAHGSVDVLDGGVLCVLTSTEERAQELIGALRVTERGFRALAVMPAFNEADVIFHSIGALIADGIDVYLLDHESTDGTVQAAEPWLGRGLVRIETMPNNGVMVWRDILRRVQEVTGEVPADWYLFVNADEFRESPWPGVTLADALREVDELSYTAVNFELFDFRPVDDSLAPGGDPRDGLLYYEPPGRHDVLQIKAWKRQPEPVDLVHHGGHDVLFSGKRVFPVPFILRHYPIRSSEHGARKVHGERLARFAAEERASGWHVQYDHYAQGASFLHDQDGLSRWDPERVRAQVLARSMRELLLTMCLGGEDPAARELTVPALDDWLRRRGEAYQSDTARLQAAKERLVAAAGGAALLPAPELDRLACSLSLALQAQARLRGDLVTAALLGDARDALSQAA